MQISNLPAEVIERIFINLELEVHIKLSHVCGRFREIIARRYLNAYLLKQEWNIIKQLRQAGWTENCDNVNLLVTLFWKVYRHLEIAWRDSDRVPGQLQSVLGIWIPGDRNGFRVTDKAIYKDKLYLALENCKVLVYNINTLLQLTTLENPSSNDDDGEVVEDQLGQDGGHALSLSCKIAQHGRTLAVKNSKRNKVRMYNCDTDELVGEIVTRAGPFYNLAMNDRLLVCLSGWCCFSWRIDTDKPDTIRGRFQGVCPDFEPSELYQNWLEVHSAAINQDYLVTRAMRVLVNPTATSGRSRIFLHVRRLGADGFIGPVLRPEDTELDRNIVELNCMRLSENNMLATMVMVKHESSDTQGVYYLRYMIQVTDIVSGQVVKCLPTESILSCVQIPVSWSGDNLFVKIVPKPSGAFLSNDDDVDLYEVSLAKWNIKTNHLCHIPHVQVNSSSDLMCLEASRLVVISTKFSHRPFVVENLENLDEDNENIHNNPEMNPRFTVKATVYDYWNTVN